MRGERQALSTNARAQELSASRLWLHVRLGLALCLLMLSSGCGLRLARPDEQPTRVVVVCAPVAMDACAMSRWLIPSPLSADQAAELALSARADASECATRHDELIACVKAHNEKD